MSEMSRVELRMTSPDLKYSVRIPYLRAAEVIQFLAQKEYQLEPIKVGRPKSKPSTLEAES